jgi:hypothetical protein
MRDVPKPDDREKDTPQAPKMMHGTACCEWTEAGAKMRGNRTKAECDALGGTWSPNPCW